MATHYFTVDVEEHFQVLALAPFVPRERWDALESRVERNVERLLELLARHRATGTFFVLGCVAERRPAMVRALVASGHEVASHGYDHRRVTELTPDAFREQVRRTKAIVEDLTGERCAGFRAPNFSIVPGKEWALTILAEEGHAYDSSLFPVRRRGYGYPAGAREPYWLKQDGIRLAEIPPATRRTGGVNLPAAGGAYLRLFPYGFVRAAFRDHERRGVPGTFYIHPWEIDPEQPRVAVPWPTRIRHYGGLSRTYARLERLLSEFRFSSIAPTLSSGAAAWPERSLLP